MKKNNKKAKTIHKTSWLTKHWKKLALGFIVFFFAALGLAVFLPQKEFVIDFSKENIYYQVSPGTTAKHQDQTLLLTKGPGDLYVATSGFYLNADQYDVCIVEMKPDVAYDEGRLFFLSPFNKNYELNFSQVFDSGKANRFNQIWINLDKHGAWKGTMRGILLLPSVKSKTIYLKRLRFIQANPTSKIHAVLSDFTRYYDPKLGSCFAMATPIFFNRYFNPLFIPLLWILLAITASVFLVTSFFKLDSRIGKISIIIFFGVFLVLWGLLDMRNNIYYLKAIGRNANLYWGKTLLEKRGIVVGDPEFINFMKFCDENIPLDGKIVNCVPKNLPGTPYQYLHATQVTYNLQTRLGKIPYYILYKSKDENLPTGIKRKNLKIYKQYNKDAYILTE
ncbi:hypothetical protein KJ766_00950 [Patescibacteria group bacterium]|nr:hypothetical protein [Patescibacteria group bacterium]